MPLTALTSLSPSPAVVERQRFCLASWVACGLQPVSINHASEHAALAGYGINIATASRNSVAQYGRPLVPINEFAAWILKAGMPALIINADVELRATTAQIDHMAELANVGVPCLARVNHDTDDTNAKVEPCGFDVFGLSPRHARLFVESFLALGSPWWDYWVPWMTLQAGELLYLSRASLAFHRRHAEAWDRDKWQMGAEEFARLAGISAGHDLSAHIELSDFAYNEIASQAQRRDL